MVRSRRTFLPLVLVAVFLMFGTVSVFAKDKDGATPVSGSSAGMSQITNPPATPTDPNGCAPNTGGGKVCHFDVSGTFTASPLGSGTYTGMVTLDYNSYTKASPCATATGTITFTNAAGDKVHTMLAPGSKVCETTPPSATHTETLILKITGGTGRFAGATGTIHSDGMTADTINPGMHTDSAKLSGSITLEHGHGCGDGHDNGDNNSHGHCGSDNGDGHGDNNGDNGND